MRTPATTPSIRVSALASPWEAGTAVVTVESTPSGLRIDGGSRDVELPFAGLTAVATHTTVTLTTPQARRPLKLDFAPVMDGGGSRVDPFDPAGLKRGAELHAEASANGMRDLLGGELSEAAGAAAAVATVVAVGAGLVAIPFAGTVRYFAGVRSPVAVFDDLMFHPDRPFGQVVQAWLPVVSGPPLPASPGRVAVLPLFRPWWRLAGLAVGFALLAAGGPVDDANVAEGAARIIGILVAVAAVVGAYVRPDADPVEMDAAAGARSQRLRAALLVVFVVPGLVALALLSG